MTDSKISLLTRKRLAACLVILSLLLNVETVFACQMMGHSGPIEHCCCDEMKQQKAAGAMKAATVCCDFDTELTVKLIDIDKDKPFVFVDSYAFDPPAWLAISLLFFLLWSALIRSLPGLFLSRPDGDPGHVGTQTWLSTSRLRI